MGILPCLAGEPLGGIETCRCVDRRDRKKGGVQKLPHHFPQEGAEKTSLHEVETTAAALHRHPGKSHVARLLTAMQLGDTEHRRRQGFVTKDEAIHLVRNVLPNEDGGPEGGRALGGDTRKPGCQPRAQLGRCQEGELRALLQFQEHEAVADFLPQFVQLVVITCGIAI